MAHTTQITWCGECKNIYKRSTCMKRYELASTVWHTVLNMQVHCAPCFLLRERKCWGSSGFYFKQHKAYRTTTEFRAFCCVYGSGSLWWHRSTGPRSASWCLSCQGGGPSPPIWKCSSPHREVRSSCALHWSCRWHESESQECWSGRWRWPSLHLNRVVLWPHRRAVNQSLQMTRSLMKVVG